MILRWTDPVGDWASFVGNAVLSPLSVMLLLVRLFLLLLLLLLLRLLLLLLLLTQRETGS